MTVLTTLRLTFTLLLIGFVFTLFQGIWFLLNQPSDLAFIGGLALIPMVLSLYLGLYHLIWRTK